MKLIQKLILLFFIIIFPVVSYLYLRSGYYVRKEALDEMSNEIKFSTQQLAILDGLDNIDTSEFKDVVAIFHKVKNNNIDDMLKYAEFLKARTDFKILAFFETPANDIALDTIHGKILSRITLPKDSIKILMGDADNILTKSLLQRNTYDSTKEGIGKLYKHTVIQLPMEGKEEIEIKRNKEM